MFCNGVVARVCWRDASDRGVRHTLEGVVLNRSPALPALENLKLLARSPGSAGGARPPAGPATASGAWDALGPARGVVLGPLRRFVRA